VEDGGSLEEDEEHHLLFVLFIFNYFRFFNWADMWVHVHLSKMMSISARAER
jgi:hypothetical protein